MMDELPIVTQADMDCRNAIYKELTGKRVPDDIASQLDWMDKYICAHRIASNTEAADLITEMAEGLTHLESEARRFAECYEAHSDGRNTFVIFADKIAALAKAGQHG